MKALLFFKCAVFSLSGSTARIADNISSSAERAKTSLPWGTTLQSNTISRQHHAVMLCLCVRVRTSPSCICTALSMCVSPSGFSPVDYPFCPVDFRLLCVVSRERNLANRQKQQSRACQQQRFNPAACYHGVFCAARCKYENGCCPPFFVTKTTIWSGNVRIV